MMCPMTDVMATLFFDTVLDARGVDLLQLIDIQSGRFYFDAFEQITCTCEEGENSDDTHMNVAEQASDGCMIEERQSYDRRWQL